MDRLTASPRRLLLVPVLSVALFAGATAAPANAAPLKGKQGSAKGGKHAKLAGPPTTKGRRPR